MHHPQLDAEGLLLGTGSEGQPLVPLDALMPRPSKKKNRGSGVPTNIQANDSLDRKTLKRMRNRVSASRCRVKRKEWITTLEEETDMIHAQNTELSQRMQELDQAIHYYRNIITTLSTGGTLEAGTTLVPPFALGKGVETTTTPFRRALQAPELDGLPIPAGLASSPSLLLGDPFQGEEGMAVRSMPPASSLRDANPTASTHRPW